MGNCIAGYHYDLNFLTVHGKARFPGLFVWLRDGRRVAVSIPTGCLLLQAGRQLEWLTAGHVRAGMHEVGQALDVVFTFMPCVTLEIPPPHLRLITCYVRGTQATLNAIGN